MLASPKSFGLREGDSLKVVLTNGCFDPFHIGHLYYLQEARKLGDVLIVSVTEDAFVNKGPDRPVFPLAQRMEVLRALAIVDNVIPTKSPEEAISKVKPHVYAKGAEYAGNLREQSLVETYGGEVVFIDKPKYSSTALIARKDLDLPRLGGWGRYYR